MEVITYMTTFHINFEDLIKHIDILTKIYKQQKGEPDVINHVTTDFRI